MALVLASVALLVFRGFNLGIDFESGLSVSIDELGSFTDLSTGEACDNGSILLFPGEHRWLICEF